MGRMSWIFSDYLMVASKRVFRSHQVTPRSQGPRVMIIYGSIPISNIHDLIKLYHPLFRVPPLLLEFHPFGCWRFTYLEKLVPLRMYILCCQVHRFIHNLGQKIICGWIKAKNRVLWIFLLMADIVQLRLSFMK